VALRGRRRRALEQLSGEDFNHRFGKWGRLDRIVDGENGRYRENCTTVDGEVLVNATRR
jgi:hypothetical protein